ncbi:AMP-binding protein [Rhodohalobacter barkolensis]|uniref:Long-chain fatty acid--CoA ligase n=1 Tax=Rhodohalobacter barkolensis TaxID=2053187 RepID=A0A2N0VHB3_9BACT|nr:AMP-binding protein [Rhodohalobacter barkolensis]PKD43581.1 long-chain fatty acid--CoA ligase [Rhodohalobacter barkolensis]
MKKSASRNRLDQMYTEAFQQNWESLLFTDYGGQTSTYGEVANQIEALKVTLKKAGLKPGDKIAIYARNSSNWATVFFSIMAFEGVVVPILPDFTPENAHHILEHSGAKALFVADSLYANLNKSELKGLKLTISTDDFRILNGKSKSSDKSAIDPSLKVEKENFSFPERGDEDLLILSYTSGSMGFSKGVMLPVRSIESNIIYARENMPLKAGDRIVSILPMAHIFGLAFENLFPVSLGCHIMFLTKVPTPQILLKALGEVKPHLILLVPLIIEKIYKKRIVPSLEKPAVKVLLAIPGIRNLIYKKTRKSLIESFGGNFHEAVVGGAALSPEVEAFFRKIEFPFTIGYGMTECGPLISYAPHDETKKGSSGRLVDRMEVRIDSEAPYKDPGEIQVKGRNLMLGYYNNKKANEQAFTKDGWFKTGDLGITDEENFIFIKGRKKNMLLGPSGQNVYPEELESRLMNFPFIQECVIIQRNNRLVAKVYPDAEMMASTRTKEEDLEDILEKTRRSYNEAVASYEQLSAIELVDQEFEKTPKKNIKRFLYT